MKTSQVNLSLQNSHPKIRPNLKRVKAALAKVVDRSKLGGQRIDIIFIDDKSIAELAGHYRKSPYPTDVLAFNYSKAASEVGAPVTSEIYISLDTAKRQARKRHVIAQSEITLLCIHGLLHIAGLRDENFKDWCAMKIGEFESAIKCL